MVARCSAPLEVSSTPQHSPLRRLRSGADPKLSLLRSRVPAGVQVLWQLRSFDGGRRAPFSFDEPGRGPGAISRRGSQEGDCRVLPRDRLNQIGRAARSGVVAPGHVSLMRRDEKRARRTWRHGRKIHRRLAGRLSAARELVSRAQVIYVDLGTKPAGSDGSLRDGLVRGAAAGSR